MPSRPKRRSLRHAGALPASQRAAFGRTARRQHAHLPVPRLEIRSDDGRGASRRLRDCCLPRSPVQRRTNFRYTECIFSLIILAYSGAKNRNGVCRSDFSFAFHYSRRTAAFIRQAGYNEVDAELFSRPIYCCAAHQTHWTGNLC